MAESDAMNFDEEDFRFSIMRDDGSEVDLVKNGRNIKVTNEKRKEYIEKVAKYYLLKECKTELKEFLKGFFQVLP